MPPDLEVFADESMRGLVFGVKPEDDFSIMPRKAAFQASFMGKWENPAVLFNCPADELFMLLGQHSALLLFVPAKPDALKSSAGDESKYIPVASKDGAVGYAAMQS
jgi:hypothetical protein